MELFDFCKDSRVITEIAPEEPASVTMNGWDFTGRPADPYRRSFSAKLYGLRWYQLPKGHLDFSTDPLYNAGRLLGFYQRHRLYKTFMLNHDYLGPLVCRFKTPLQIQPAIMNSAGLIEAFDIMLIHHNPSYE